MISRMSDSRDDAQSEKAGTPAPQLGSVSSRLLPLVPWFVAFSLVNLPFVLARTRFSTGTPLIELTQGLTYNFIWAGLNLSVPLVFWAIRRFQAELLPADATPQQRRRARRRWTLRLIALTLSSLCALVVIEIFLRVSMTHATWLEANGGSYVSPYETGGRTQIFALGPNQVTQFHMAEFTYEIKANREGLWDIEHPLEKPPGEYRIAFLGDSFTMGQGAPFEQTWVQQLQRSFDKSPRKGPVRALAAGIFGSDPVFQVRLFEERLLKYAPDLVVQVVNGSDLKDISVRGGFERFRPDGTLKYSDAPRVEWVMGKSRLARMILMDVWGYDHFGRNPEERAARTATALDVMVEAAKRLKGLGEKHGFEVLVVLHPFRNEIHTGIKGPLFEEGFVERVRTAGVRAHNLLPFMEREMTEANVADYFWPKDGHCNPAGYRLFARGVEEALQEVPGFPPKE
mgnify:CR=1 FL=1